MSRPSAVARLVRGLWPATAVALLGMALLALPAGRALEQSVGLGWLYALRGDREPPQGVSIVAIDARAAAALGLRPNPREWPRSLHAELLRYLSRSGARVVAFDLLFSSARDDGDDRMLARAIADAGNVVLAARLERDTEPVRDVPQKLVRERYVEPIALLADAALGVAPVVLPKTPRIDMFWAFKEEGWETPGLSAVVLQAFERDTYPALLQLATKHNNPGAALPAVLGERHIERTVWSVRRTFLDAGLRAGGSGPATPDALARLVALYTGEGTRYLNFYGGPGRIATHPYDRVLAAARGEPGAPPMDFTGKVVLVGVAEVAQTEQRDNYHTLYSRDDGVDLSGVEITATAVANLLDGTVLRSPGRAAEAAVLAGTFLLAFACWLLPIGAAAATTAATAAGYLLFASAQFAQAALWWPVVVPLAVQAPVAFVLGLWLQYRDARRERDRILDAPARNRALGTFARDLNLAPGRGGEVFSVCLNGDIEGSSKLGTLLPDLSRMRLMNRYFATICPEIRRNRGLMLDDVGDAFQAGWLSARPGADLRNLAVQAGLDVLSALRAFNALSDHPPMNVRLGLHCGMVALGPWGTEGHFEYRIVGSVVDVAARIQALNKEMGTRLLASGQALEGLPNWLARPLGRFRLIGIQAVLDVYQPLRLVTEADDGQRWLCERSREALAAWTGADFGRALLHWESILERDPTDGPARYHAELCREMQDKGPADRDGTIRQTSK